MNTITRQIVLAAGGTGGHMYPAQALSAALVRQGCQVTLITDERGETYKKTGEFHQVHVISWKPRPGFPGKIFSVFSLLATVKKCRDLLKVMPPDLVVGFGGHPSLPTLMAAKKIGIPILLHEQNAVMGRVNRLLARAATGIAVSFKSVEGLKKKHLRKVLYTGTPVRPAIIEMRALPYRAPSLGGEMVILCIGGSQGAAIFSQILPGAFALLSPEERQRLHVHQQCHIEDNYNLSMIYNQLGLNYDLSGFFDDIGERIHASHLVIARAGASTIAELTTAGRPAILVPYPAATDDHQTVNAQMVSRKGGAILAPQPDLTPEKLAAVLRNLLSSPKILTKMARAARTAGIPDASKRLAQVALAILNATHRPPPVTGKRS